MKDELSCQQVARMISDDLDVELPPTERARIRMHFVICAACRNVNEQMAFLRRALRGLGRNDQAD